MNKNLNDTNDSSRRDFLKKFGSAVAGLTLIGSFSSVIQSCSSNSIDVGPGADAGKTLIVDASSLTSDNMAIHATAPVSSRGLLVVRRNSTTYETILLVCPHQGCSYPNVDLSGSVIVCTCHDSRFDLNGTVTSGPSNSNLTRFTSTFDATTKKVTVTF